MIRPQFIIGGIIGFVLGYVAHSEKNWMEATTQLQPTIQTKNIQTKTIQTKSNLVESPIQVIQYPHFRIVYSKVNLYRFSS